MKSTKTYNYNTLSPHPNIITSPVHETTVLHTTQPSQLIKKKDEIKNKNVPQDSVWKQIFNTHFLEDSKKILISKKILKNKVFMGFSRLLFKSF